MSLVCRFKYFNLYGYCLKLTEEQELCNVENLDSPSNLDNSTSTKFQPQLHVLPLVLSKSDADESKCLIASSLVDNVLVNEFSQNNNASFGCQTSDYTGLSNDFLHTRNLSCNFGNLSGTHAVNTDYVTIRLKRLASTIKKKVKIRPHHDDGNKTDVHRHHNHIKRRKHHHHGLYRVKKSVLM